MKKAKLGKGKAYSQCAVIGSLPYFKGCGNIQPINRIKKIKLYENGDCYDQHDNYLGKGKFVDGVLQVERANYL